MKVEGSDRGTDTRAEQKNLLQLTEASAFKTLSTRLKREALKNRWKQNLKECHKQTRNFITLLSTEILFPSYINGESTLSASAE